MNIDQMQQDLIARISTVNDEEILSMLDKELSFSLLKPEIDIYQYNKEIDEAMARMDSGEYTTHEHVVREMEAW